MIISVSPSESGAIVTVEGCSLSPSGQLVPNPNDELYIKLSNNNIDSATGFGGNIRPDWQFMTPGGILK